jgi:hypothetical protein
MRVLKEQTEKSCTTQSWQNIFNAESEYRVYWNVKISERRVGVSKMQKERTNGEIMYNTKLAEYFQR